MQDLVYIWHDLKEVFSALGLGLRDVMTQLAWLVKHRVRNRLRGNRGHRIESLQQDLDTLRNELERRGIVNPISPLMMPSEYHTVDVKALRMEMDLLLDHFSLVLKWVQNEEEEPGAYFAIPSGYWVLESVPEESVVEARGAQC